MDRTLFSGGPAYLTHNGIVQQMHDDNWTLAVSDEVVERKTNLHGLVGASKNYSLGKLTYTPIATTANLAALLAYLFPYQPSHIGSLVFPSVDRPAIIQTRDGKSITLAAAAVTKMPPLTFAPGKDFIGQVELTCLIKNNTEGTEAGDFVAVATSTYSEPTLDPLSLISSLFAVAWGGSAPFNGIETNEDGVVFAPTVSLADQMTNNAGLLNYRVQDVGATVKFTPVNIDAGDFFASFMRLDNSVARGQLVGARGQTLTVTGVASGDPRLTIASAVPTESADVRFGSESRIGEVTLTAHRKFATTLQPLYALGLV